MTLKWTMDSVWSAALVIVTVIGGISGVIYYTGASASQVTALEQKQIVVDAHLAKHDDQLSAIQQQEAAAVQQLKDIADTVHDMRDHGVKTHGNH